jgi:hypothetical protein
VTAAGANNLSIFQNRLKAAGVAWRYLDTVAKATVIGAALAVVVALGYAFSNLSDRMGEAAQKQADLNEVNIQAEKSIASQRIETDKLLKVVNDTNIGLDERKGALSRLIEISPDYFKGLTIEKDGLDKINTAYNAYIENIKNAARAQAAKTQIDKIASEVLALEQERDAKIAQQKNRPKTSSALGSGSGLAFGDTSELITSEYNSKIKVLNQRIDSLADVQYQANKATQTVQDAAVENITAEAKRIAELQKLLDEANAKLLGGNKTTGGNPKATKKATKTEDFQFKDVASGLTVINDAAILTNGELTKLSTEILPVLSENQTAFALALGYSSDNFYTARDAALAHEEALARVATQMETVAALGQAVGDAIFQASADGAASLADLAKAGANAARSFIAQQIAMGVAAQVRSALGTGLAGLLLAPIAGGAAAALFNRLIPKFADGGIISGPTFGLMGEYPGASTNPEVVAPLSKLKGMLQDAGGGAVAVYGRLSGADILISSERSDTRRALRRGY